ncbi:LapA family protein [Domibacillus epiphyticus]|uniref:Lipopolysaccharide assembly protein A domain-containing protein n=1 Tax=Domibacillus epiphyticus TaxID=1714355 RepID=A0A1V2A9A6_9BACI|nr:lipopolysaccharide assembly protein LapA domain-containing protein [Domibacillus epiphyticus]OMP67573.1 hypothetical protein BTO28_06410 [Domibacillus epiphyticus]
MKIQTALILGLIFALATAIFAVVNVDPVTVNYVFGRGEWPLILVILFSILMGGSVIFMFGLLQTAKLKQQNKDLLRQNELLKKELHEIKQKNRETLHPDANSIRLVPDGE